MTARVHIFEVHNMSTSAPSLIASYGKEMDAQAARAKFTKAWPRNRIEIFAAGYQDGVIRVHNHCLPDGCRRYVLADPLPDSPALIREALSDYIARAMRSLLRAPM